MSYTVVQSPKRYVVRRSPLGKQVVARSQLGKTVVSRGVPGPPGRDAVFSTADAIIEVIDTTVDGSRGSKVLVSQPLNGSFGGAETLREIALASLPVTLVNATVVTAGEIPDGPYPGSGPVLLVGYFDGATYKVRRLTPLAADIGKVLGVIDDGVGGPMLDWVTASTSPPPPPPPPTAGTPVGLLLSLTA